MTTTFTNEQISSLKFETLPIKGMTFKSVKNDHDEQLVFVLADDAEVENARWRSYRLYHSQSCCESVYIDQVDGDLNDLVGVPLMMAEMATMDDESNSDAMWTFYKFATLKGYVTVRWHGSSNGYYSISVNESWFDEQGQYVY